MARIDSKQLNPALTGSFTLSGSLLGNTVSSASFGALDVDGTLKFGAFADVSASLAAAVAGGDNLGNHTATQDLNINGKAIKNVLHISASGNISSSISSTGSFGHLMVGGGIFTSASLASGGSGVGFLLLVLLVYKVICMLQVM